MDVITPASAEHSPVRAGARSMLPFVAAYAPFAIGIGAAVSAVDDPLVGWSGSWLIYGGSAQLAAVRGLASGTVAMAIVTGLIVNARLLLYGSSLASRWRDHPRWFRVLAPALLIDPTWALADRDDGRSPADQRRFFLAAGLTLGIGWSTAMAVGVLAGDRLPGTGTHLAAPLCLVALVAPRLRDRAHRRAATAAVIVAVATHSMPSSVTIASSILVGALAATTAGSSAG